MDASRRSDLGRAEAISACRDLATSQTATSGVRSVTVVAGLAAIEDEEELEFVGAEIQRRVTESGQEFAHEQWWTAGRSLAGRWVWDVAGYPTGLNSYFIDTIDIWHRIDMCLADTSR